MMAYSIRNYSQVTFWLKSFFGVKLQTQHFKERLIPRTGVKELMKHLLD
jgi:hypothetical protein